MTLEEKSCIICDGKGFYDIHYMNWRKKSETLPCPWCYSDRKPFINHIVEMSKIWRNAWSNFIQYHYMANPSTPEEKEHINQNFFCKNIRHNFFRVAVLETAKLIKRYKPDRPAKECSNQKCPNKVKGKNKSDIYTIAKLIETNNSGMNIWEQELLWEDIKLEHHLAHEGILTLRDRLYAHTDDVDISIASFTNDQFKAYLLEIKTLILELNRVLAFNQGTIFILSGSSIERQVENWDDFRLLMEAKKARRLGLTGA